MVSLAALVVHVFGPAGAGKGALIEHPVDHLADAAGAAADHQQVRSVTHPAIAVGRRADVIVRVVIEEVGRGQEQERQYLARPPALIAVAARIAETAALDLPVLLSAIAERAPAARRASALPLALTLSLRLGWGVILWPSLEQTLRAALGLIVPLGLGLGLRPLSE